MEKRLADQQLLLEVTDAAKELIVEKAYDPIYGARPLKRYIQSKVETLIGRLIIAENLEPQSKIYVDAKEGEIVVY